MSPIFPASYSTLHPDALASLFSEKYGLENTGCRLLVRGVGDTYLITSGESKYILRVYRATHRSLPQITAEVELLLALQQAQVPVSYPIRDLNQEAIQAINAIEGRRHAVLFTYAPGKVVRQFSEKQLQVLGREMARFHNVSSTLNLAGNSRYFNFETTLTGPLGTIKANFAEIPDDYEWLQQVVERAIKVLDGLATAGFSSGYCQFDFLPKNFHFDGDAITFFDFDFMGYGWLANDIATFYQHLCLDVFTGRMTQEAADNAFSIFLKAYRDQRVLSEQEVSAIPYLSLGFWLFYMGFHTTHDQFFAFTQPAHLKGIVAYLRQMVAKYWLIG